jgi:hypothetical protein
MPGCRLATNYLQLLLAGDWNANARISETLEFRTENEKRPLVSPGRTSP